MRASVEPTSILVHLPNWLGDVVMCTPALRALRRRYPEARITLAGKQACLDVLEGLPCFDAGIALGARPTWRELRTAAKSLPARPRLGIALPHSARAALLLVAAGCATRVGYNRGGRRLLLTLPVEPYRENGVITPIYMAREYLDLLAPLDCVDDGEGLSLHADASAVAQVKAQLDPARPVVGIAPGAAFGPSKRWLPERFAAVAAWLTREHNAQCLLFTGPGEEDTRDAVRAACPVPLLEPTVEAAGIARLKAGIAAIDLLIGNDSAPRHMAVAFGVPVICIMGSTSPRYTAGPWEKGAVVRIDVDCGPCQKPVCATDHRCMTGVPVERVCAEAAQWIGGRKQGPASG